MKKTLTFLRKLKSNNNREWFAENKALYDSSHEEMKTLIENTSEQMLKHDLIDGKGKLFRIYRDVRFSRDKSPYKSSWSGSFKRATHELRGGYYFHIEPGNNFMAGGFFNPNSEDLLHLRKHISADQKAFEKSFGSKKFKDYFGNLQGDQLKTIPKGFDKEDPALEWLKFKQFIFRHKFTNQEVESGNFHKLLNTGFKNLRPFFDHMSYLLTHDLNGVPIKRKS